MSPERSQIINLCSGPSALPESVVNTAAEAVVNYLGTGMGIQEISHRSKYADDILASFESNLRSFLKVPSTHTILLSHGGGTAQFSAVPYNLFADIADTTKKAKYIVSGVWSEKAFKEADRLGFPATVLASSRQEDGKYHSLPDSLNLKELDPKDTAYVYYCDNETIHGIEFKQQPEVPAGIHLVADMSSSFMTKPIEFEKHAIVFAAAQKNVGPTGLCIVIVNNAILQKEVSISVLKSKGIPICPTLFDYRVIARERSLLNTVPLLAILEMDLFIQSTKERNPTIEQHHQYVVENAAKLYEKLDKYPQVYKSDVTPASRSRTTMPFSILTNEMEKAFFIEGAQRGLRQFNGHRSVGGARIALFNALVPEQLEKVLDFLEDFGKRNTN